MLLATERIDEMLDLGHQELADAEQTSTWRDLVSEGLANGGGREWHLLLVELEKLGEVEELTLSSLWTEVAWGVAAGADGRLEHEIEGYWWLWLNTGVRVLHLVLLDEQAEFGAIVVIDLSHASV